RVGAFSPGCIAQLRIQGKTRLVRHWQQGTPCFLKLPAADSFHDYDLSDPLSYIRDCVKYTLKEKNSIFSLQGKFCLHVNKPKSLRSVSISFLSPGDTHLRTYLKRHFLHTKDEAALA
uniref:Uncharacterized protein n=1 Tax=Crocodylus porosus TaxID=8502 RepID=A0A7M4EXX7_CROPO